MTFTFPVFVLVGSSVRQTKSSLKSASPRRCWTSCHPRYVCPISMLVMGFSEDTAKVQQHGLYPTWTMFVCLFVCLFVVSLFVCLFVCLLACFALLCLVAIQAARASTTDRCPLNVHACMPLPTCQVLKWSDGSTEEINGTYVTEGTFPPGSMYVHSIPFHEMK